VGHGGYPFGGLKIPRLRGFSKSQATRRRFIAAICDGKSVAEAWTVANGQNVIQASVAVFFAGFGKVGSFHGAVFPLVQRKRYCIVWLALQACVDGLVFT